MVPPAPRARVNTSAGRKPRPGARAAVEVRRRVETMARVTEALWGGL